MQVTGKVKKYNDEKGYGFFSRDDGSGDVFFHRSALPTGAVVSEGDAARFEIEQSPKGLRAVNIALG